MVDKDSSDKTLAIARESADQIIQDDGQNSAQARNMAHGQARGDIVCFTNGDCIPESGWLEEITKPLSDPQIVGSKGAYTAKQKNVTSCFIQLEFEEKYRRLQKDDRIDFIDGYSAGYRREILEANKGFDERFDMLEDQELSYRLASRGCRMVFVQDALVDHHHITRFFLSLRSKYQIAHWTSQVVRKFPDHAYRDSYTPQIFRVQIFLIALLLFSLVLARWNLNALMLSSLIFASFLLTTLPFLIRTWPSDPTVALLAPIFFDGRACALGIGYVVGAIRFTTVGGHEKSTKTGLSYHLKRAMDLVGSIFGMRY